MNHSKLALISFIFIQIGACVSVQMPNTATSHSNGVEFKSPASPFSEFKSEGSDKAWISQSTANTISFLSDCNPSHDPSLEQMESDSLSVLNKLKVQDRSTTIFNGREANRATAEGLMDGVAVKMSVLVFKKNSCSYTLTYAGIQGKFSSELSIDEDFLKSFKAP